MSVFDTIKEAIWGHPSVAPPIATAPPTGATTLPGTVPPAGVTPTVPVDVNAVLSQLAAKNPQTLDWQHSIVDLMKLLALDSSFQNRAALAKELGYTGSSTDSAQMNTWLYKQVMQRLAASGGKVPPELYA